MNADPEMLTIRGLQKTYGKQVHALKGVDLGLPRGVFGLLGPNGSGKSTLMRILATLQQPDAGEVHFEGRNLLREPQFVRARLGYLPQDFGVPPDVSARDLLDYLAALKGIVSRGERRSLVGEILERVNLADVADRDVASYSGGMKQRFGVAQVLLRRPSLVIVDEPTAGLDPLERNRLQLLLREIGQQAVVILSTHIVEDVANVCGELAILVRGRVLRRGTPTEVVRALEGRVFRARVPDAASLGSTPLSPLHTRPLADSVQVTVVADEPPPSPFVLGTPDLEDVYHLCLREAGAA